MNKSKKSENKDEKLGSSPAAPSPSEEAGPDKVESAKQEDEPVEMVEETKRADDVPDLEEVSKEQLLVEKMMEQSSISKEAEPEADKTVDLSDIAPEVENSEAKEVRPDESETKEEEKPEAVP